MSQWQGVWYGFFFVVLLATSMCVEHVLTPLHDQVLELDAALDRFRAAKAVADKKEAARQKQLEETKHEYFISRALEVRSVCTMVLDPAVSHVL